MKKPKNLYFHFLISGFACWEQMAWGGCLTVGMEWNLKSLILSSAQERTNNETLDRQGGRRALRQHRCQQHAPCLCDTRAQLPGPPLCPQAPHWNSPLFLNTLPPAGKEGAPGHCFCSREAKAPEKIILLNLC